MLKLSTIFLILALAGCASKGTTLTVTGKEYLYPKFQKEWLAPCDQPKIPVAKGKATTNEDLMLYVTSLINALDRCNLKITSINKSYTQFKKDTVDATKAPPTESNRNP